MEDASDAPELTYTFEQRSAEDLYEDSSTALQERLGENAGSRELKDGSHVNVGLTLGQQDFMPSQKTMQDALPERDTSMKHVIATNPIEMPDVMQARAAKRILTTLGFNSQQPRSTGSLDAEAMQSSSDLCRLISCRAPIPEQGRGTADGFGSKLSQQEPSTRSENIQTRRRIFLQFKNMAQRLTRTEPLPNHKRIEWKCVSFRQNLRRCKDTNL
jgi:hypothetical protein